MCVISMVYDHFNPLIPRPVDFFTTPGWITVTPPTKEDIDRLEKILADFHKAAEAAKVVDEKTGQPDCADREKAKLEARVAELEKRIAELQKPKKSRRRSKRRPAKRT